MTRTISGQGPDMTAPPNLGAVANELTSEAERLKRLAEELKACEVRQAEMRTNYPHLKQAVYAALREHFERELPPLPDKDLEALAAEEGALPLEAFLTELEGKTERP